MFLRRLALVLLSFLITAAGLAAQAPGVEPAQNPNPRSFDASGFGKRIALGPAWLFMPGDDPAWSAPRLDDSGWRVISTGRPLTDYGFHDQNHVWYRMHLRLRPGVGGATVGVTGTSGSYEVYANGVRIGSAGKIAGMVSFDQAGLIAYQLPDGLIGPAGDVVLALRFAPDRSGALGRGTSNPLDATSGIYLMSTESAVRESSFVNAHSAWVPWFLAILAFLSGSIALSLFGAMRSQLEYLVVGLYLLAEGIEYALRAWFSQTAFTVAGNWVSYFFSGLAAIAIIEFVRIVLGRPRTRVLIGLQIAVFVCGFWSPLSLYGLRLSSFYVGFVLYFLPTLIVSTLLIWMLMKGWLRESLDARILLPAVILTSGVQYWSFLRFVAYYLHLTTVLHRLPVLHLGTYGFSLYDLGKLVLYITFLLFLILRTVGIARERARISAELEAARTTQRLLLAREGQATPGFLVESVYHPASEVGGDFFLIAPTGAGSLLVVVGDVSGKGLIAAMRVAMILGVLHREDSRDPDVVLHNLNEAMRNDGGQGFATACCLRLDQDGGYTLANAGHISPYVDGAEIATPPALPLGLASDQHYLEISGSIAVGQRLVLLSDGVLEAQSARGELLGFDRMAILTRSGAREIADTAKAFGQKDDITVLTLQRAVIA